MGVVHRRLGWLIGGLTLWPCAAMAHVSERAIVLLLPTDIYRNVGVLAVVGTVLLTLFLPPRVRTWFHAEPSTPQPPPAGPLATLGFAIFATLIAFGLWGPHDPLSNLLPLTLFSLWWLCMLLLAAILGNFWQYLNPWAAPVRWLFRGHARPIPDWLSDWPTLASYLAFAVYYLSDTAPSDPGHLARATLLYWGTHLALAGLYGPVWLQRGEGFGLLFDLAGRMSPIRWRMVRLQAPGARLVAPGPGNISTAIFVVSFLAIGSFDGLNETFWWMAQIGINPLEFPGRSAVIWQNRIGLAGAVITLNLAFALMVWLGLALVRATSRMREAWPRLALTLMPIALAYHFAHYLPSLLVSLQYWLLALNDPLDSGARLLGLDWRVTTSFFNQHASVRAIWLTQAGVIVIGHMLSVLLAHVVALDLFANHKRALISQIFVAAFMVAYTWFGLWLLASPTAL